jgi:hypothetical protein
MMNLRLGLIVALVISLLIGSIVMIVSVLV